MSGGEGFGLHFGRLLVALGSLCQVFFKVLGWNFDGHRGDQTWILVDDGKRWYSGGRFSDVR